MEELKMRGAPTDEIPKSPLLRKKQEEKPHNAVEEALQHAVPKETHESHKVALITGASGGIGKAIALHLASSNYNLVLIARKKEPLHELERELGKYRIRVLVKECDVTKVAQVHDVIQHASKTFGRIDVLVNSAGYGVYGDLENMKIEDINGQMLTNYFGTVLFIKECLPKLKETSGLIINIASMAGLMGMPKMAAYGASKHAVVGLSEALRYELADTGVAVSCICPGKVDSKFFEHESFKNVQWAEEKGIPPGAVARTIDKAIHERKFLYAVPKTNKLMLFIGRLLPESIRLDYIKNRMKE